jgi:hypothetical protein
MHRQAKHYNSLAASLKSPRKSSLINDIIYNFINTHNLSYQWRQSISYICFSLAAIQCSTNPSSLNIFAIADYSTRYQYGGLILALAPIFLCLYFCDQAVHRFFKKTRRRNLLSCFVMLGAPLIPIALDLGLFAGQTNLLSAALFIFSSAIIWPQRRKRNYYSKKRLNKKHLDKRTK